MKEKVQLFGRALSGMVMPNIGAFIAWGLITALFISTGWCPNETLAQLVDPMSKYLLPFLIGYTGGKVVGDHRGGVIGAIGTFGVIVGSDIPMFIGAMIMGPLSAWILKKFDKLVEGKIKAGFEMLVNNFSLGIIGAILACAAMYLIAPAVTVLNSAMEAGVGFFVDHGLLPLASIFIEPAKVLFLNNAINHGILSPMGIQQVKEVGKSVFLLLEANPGPGLGVLLALWLSNRKKRKEYAAYMFVECIGGIHEIYFPEVLANLWLLLALIPGGMAGTLCMSVFHVASAGLVSPGSILTVLFMSGHHVLATLFAVAISTAVSCVIAFFILKRQGKWCTEAAISAQEEKEEAVQEKRQVLEKELMLEIKIGFICDAGVGSSAMGAALFRRKLKEEGMNGIAAEAYAVDQIPEDLTIGVCQREFLEILQKESNLSNIVTMESLLNQTEHLALIEKLRKGDITQ